MYECPSINYRCKDNKISFNKGKGFTNPLNHLKACLYSGSLDDILSLYEENFQGQQNNLSQFFKPVINITTKENTIAKWIRLISEEILSLTVIQKKSFRKFNGGAEQLLFSQEKLKVKLYNMVEIFEGRISAEVKDATRGSILHDGWTKNGVHFFAIYECYIKKVSISSYYGVIEEPQIILID